ncbi:MAG TPA: DEAD/DEAH box helicase [Thermoanaerobaculia bacterium]|nr:DEAD/DEAH box helicase [Thermoanaerobaculia bacterium]
MPRTRTAAASTPKGRKKSARPPQGWRTTDEDEIERRRQRAAGEPLVVEALEAGHPVFGTFRVSSETGSSYEVEIRSLAERDNSCGCPDYEVNGLGTCKHVEAVLARVGMVRQRAKPRIEVFLRRTGERPEVRAQGLERSAGSAAQALADRYFTAKGALRGDPLVRLPALARALAAVPPRVQAEIRLSRHLLPWVEEQRRKAARQTARERFLAEVQAGRATLDVVQVPLYPYQQEGMLHLAFTERALLADEMGLGKTVQAIAACELLRRLRGIERVLVVCPASLKGEWEEQIARFSGLPSRIVAGPRAQRLAQYDEATGEGEGAFFYLANYEQILIDADAVQQRLAPDVIILDEAQRIKNWQSRTAQAVKRLRSPYAFVLTGTPLENRIDEIYSIAQFLDPSLLGPLFRFNREFYLLDERGRPAGYRNLDELHRRLAPVLLRRRKDEVEGQLPGRLDKHYFVPLEDEQIPRYLEYEKRVAQILAEARRRPLLPKEFEQLQRWLACMRMVCDTPYILDSECRICPKLTELREILGELLAEPGTKILVFSEWARMLDLVREALQEMGTGFAWHTGSVPLARRRDEVRRFKEDPGCRLFLSTDSGGVGLNLQAANVVINLDLPWNPARLEQRIARAWRKHQTRPVRVLYLVTEDTIEHRMIPLLANKQRLADGVLDGRGELSEMPLPSGRKALVERLETLTGLTGAPSAPARAADPWGPLGGELRTALGEGLLRLEIHPGRDGREVLLVVAEDAVEDAVEDAAAGRPRIEEILSRHFAGTTPPVLELLARSAYEALERLVESGVLSFPAEGRRLLHSAPAPGTERDPQRERRLAAARATFAQAERKIRMAIVLAGGGFAIEGLPALREGVELGLQARARMEGLDLLESQPVPTAWIADRLPTSLPLLDQLRAEPGTLIGATEEDVRAWIAGGEALAAEIERELRQAG